MRKGSSQAHRGISRASRTCWCLTTVECSIVNLTTSIFSVPRSCLSAGTHWQSSSSCSLDSCSFLFFCSDLKPLVVVLVPWLCSASHSAFVDYTLATCHLLNFWPQPCPYFLDSFHRLLEGTYLSTSYEEGRSVIFHRARCQGKSGALKCRSCWLWLSRRGHQYIPVSPKPLACDPPTRYKKNNRLKVRLTPPSQTLCWLWLCSKNQMGISHTECLRGELLEPL